MERARMDGTIGWESGGVKGDPEPAGSTGVMLCFTVEDGDFSGMPNSAYHGPRPGLNGVPFNQVLGSETR